MNRSNWVKITCVGVSAEECHVQRSYYKSNQIKKEFIKWLAYTGQLDGKMSKSDIKLAKTGVIDSKKYDCHHIIPLSCGGNSEFNNLVIIHKSYHRWLNKNVYDPILNGIKEGEIRELMVPKFKGFEPVLPEFANQKFNYIIHARTSSAVKS